MPAQPVLNRRSALAVLACVAALLVAVGCTSTTSSSAGSGGGSGSVLASGPTSGGAANGTVVADPCPVAPIPVVVSVDQWGDIVSQLAGRCAQVTTIISGSSADPHGYEPTPADSATFTGAKLVVVNGVDYDPWATKAVDTLSNRPVVVDAGRVVGRQSGDNPHLWYSPDFVDQVSRAVTTELRTLSPGAGAYFDQQATAWQSQLQPYRDRIAAIRQSSAGKTYGATESVFDDMARAVGLVDVTPAGYRNAAANESDPAPGDINEFQSAIRDKKIEVLIVNTQTEGAIPAQIRDTAKDASVPVVEITETVPPQATSFVQWQLAQLDALQKALT